MDMKKYSKMVNSKYVFLQENKNKFKKFFSLKNEIKYFVYCYLLQKILGMDLYQLLAYSKFMCLVKRFLDEYI